MFKHLQKLLLIAALLCVPWVTQAQTPGDLVSTFPYECDFESSSDYGSWVTVNGTQENGWYIGTAVNATTGGSQALYVSNDQGVSNAYGVTTDEASYSWAYQRFTFSAGGYNISFKWRNYGEIDSDPYDFFRVFIVPDNVTLTAGTLPSTSYTWSNQFMSDVPAGWIGINNGVTTYFVDDSVFSTVNAEFTINTTGNYKLVFLWLNDDNTCNNPAAAVDDISITENSCPPPSGVMVDANVSDSVVVSWTSFSSVSNYDIVIIPSTATFDETTADIQTVSGDDVVIDTLTPGIYNLYIRSNCGSETSSWVGPVNFNSLPEYYMPTTGTATLYTCNRTIYDVGGPNGQYENSSASTLNIYPVDAEHVLKIWGNSWTESSWDYLRITDLMTNEVVFCDNQSGVYSAVIDTMVFFGGVQLYFYSDGSVCSYDGFEVHVTCIDAPTCMPVQNLAVTGAAPDSIYLSWTDDANTGASYLVEYRTGNGAWTSMEVNDTIAEIGDLTLNTLYEFKVTALCGGSDSSMTAGPITARTLAGAPISEFPYVCGFEIDLDNEINEASAWVLENGTQANYWMVGNATNNGGSRSMYITNNGSSNAYSTGSESYVFAYATFQFDTGNYAYSFDWKAYGESSYDFIRAALVPTAVDFTAGSYCGFNNTSGVPAGGIALDGAYRLNLQSDWQTQSGEFNIAQAGLYKMVFMWRNDGSGGTTPPAAIDNVMVGVNTCPKPASLHTTLVTSDSIAIAWQPGGQEQEWIVRIGQNEYSVNTTSYVFSNLQPNTNYHITVQAVCSPDDSSMYVGINVRTACGVITELPIFENFETTGTTSSGNNNFIPCWNKLNNATSYYYPYVSNSTTYNHTPNGAYGIYWYNTTTQTTYGDYQVIVLPGIDTNALPVNTTQLSFWARSSSTSYYPVFYVGVMSDPDSINTFQYFDTINVGNSTQWQKYTTYFANFTGEGQYIAIRADRPSSSWYAYVDDITLDSMYSCFEPVDVNVLTAVQPDSVVINWAPNALGNTVGYEIVVGPAGFDPDTATNVITLNDTVYTFTNLFGGVSYDFYVRADCGNTDGYSHWTEPMSFSPGQYVIGTTGSASISMCGGVIYDDGGPNGQYSNNVDYQLTVYPSSPDSMITFYGSAYTESSIDYLRIYEGVGTNGNLLWQTSTSSAQDNIPLTTCMSGPITLHFHTDGSVVYNGFDVHINCIAAPECAAVENLTVNAGPVSAIATWDEGFFGVYSGATVEYKEDTASEWTVLPMTSNKYITITGLTPNTDYNLRVTTDCEGFAGNFATVNFSTRDFGCLVSDPTLSHNDTVTGTSQTSYNIPVNNFYHNTFSEQLYTASDLNGSGTMVSFSLHYGYSSPMTDKTNCLVYMANTTLSSITTSSYVDPATMTLVYTGSLNCSQGWNDFVLDSPFNYSGGNLVVAVIDNSDAYDGSAYVWNCHAATNKAFSWYSDSYFYPNSSMSKTNHSFRPDMSFSFLSCIQYNTCAAPVAAVVDVTTTTIDVAWAPGNAETSWNVYYRQAGATSYTQAASALTTTFYQFTNLNPGTNYEFKVEGVCDTQLLASELSAATLCATIASLPYVEDFNNWGTGSLPNCWYNTGAYSTSSYSIISGNQNMSGATGGSIYMYSSSSATYISRIITPAIDTNLFQVNQTQVVFYVKYTSTSYGTPTFVVGVMEDPNDLSTFTPVDTVQHSGALNTWEPMEVPLANYTGEGSHVVIQTLYPGTYFYCYLDNLTIEPLPTCPRPDSLMSSNPTTTSVNLSWHERGGATNWIIEYGPRGFAPGTGTQVAVNSNPYTLAGLPVAYQGEFYVKSICSSSDTGEFSRLPGRFTCAQVPATLPYDYDFDTPTEFGSWQTCSNVATDWFRGNAVAEGGSGYSMYISADNGATYKPYNFNSVVNAAIYRDVDFGNVNSSFTISFDARVGGTLSASYDGLMVFLVDPTVTPVASHSNITSPWGDVNNLYRIATVRLDTVWNTYQASFDTISGVKRVAFFWFNQNTGASYANIAEPAAVDNIHIEVSSCARPVATQVNAVSSSTANLSWFGPSAANYQVIYREYPNGSVNNYATSATNSITLTGLTPVTQYAVWVRKICSTGDTSLTSDGVLFNTELCDNAVTVTNFDTTSSTTTSSYSPIGYATYNYSYVQTIIDSARMAELGGDVTAFAFDAASTTSSNYYTNMDVYMANVPEGNLSSGFIHPDDSAHVFVKVIENGNFNFDAVGQHLFGFDTTFTWDGHSNVLFAVNRKHGSWSSSTSFNAHSASSSKMRYVYSDGSAYDPTTVSGGTASSTVGDIYLVSCGGGCREPGAVNFSDMTYQSATASWPGSATSYEVAVKAATDPTWPAETAVAGNTYNITGLTAATTYQFRVRAICDADAGDISDWTVASFVTDSLPCFTPSGFENTAATVTEATFNWTVNGEENMWNIHIWNTAFDSNYVVNAHPATVGGLAQNLTYNAAVSALCGGGAVESDFSDTIQFTTATCQPVTNAAAGSITAHTAVITWNGNATSYDLEYGRGDFGIGTGTQVNGITATSYTLTDLVDDAAYTVYIRANCEGQPSAWSQVQFTTAVGIDMVNGVNVTIYPNPTTTSTTIALSGITGEVSIAIVDMNGRTVRTDSMSCEGDCVKTIEVSGLAQGAYFVRVNGEGVNMVKKLVVK